MPQGQDAQQQGAPLPIIVAAPHRQRALILPETATVVPIHLCKTPLPAVILRAVAAAHVAIPAVAVLPVHPVVAVVLQEEDRY